MDAAQQFHTKIKICGLWRESDIDFVNEARPDYAGFVFAASKRQIPEETAFRLSPKLACGIIPVGVFVDAPVSQILRLYDNKIISAAQLHGAEDAAYIAALKKRAGIPVIKAIKISHEFPPELLCADGADFILFDSGSGSGKPFDWSILQHLCGAFNMPWFLAGGLHLGNLDAALAYHPFGVDISSGAENGGVKDRDKINALVNKTRQS